MRARVTFTATVESGTAEQSEMEEQLGHLSLQLNDAHEVTGGTLTLTETTFEIEEVLPD